MAAELVVLALAIGVGVVLTRYFPTVTRRWFGRIVAARRIVFVVVGILLALVFISSGSGILMLIGFFMLLYGILYVILDPEGWFGGIFS